MEVDDYMRQQAKELGFNPSALTDRQIYVLIEPVFAPENYYNDGEITPDQAKTIWRKKMKESGFTLLQIFQAEKKMNL